MHLKTLSDTIAAGGWTFSTTREQVYGALARSAPKSDEYVPACVLTAWRYLKRDLTKDWRASRERLGTLALIAGQDDPLAECVSAILPKPAPLLTPSLNDLQVLAAAFNCLQRSHPRTWAELSCGIEFISIVDTAAYRSCSSPRALGCLVLTRRALQSETADLATSLVHELGHQELFMINLYDALTVNAAPASNAYAPYQERIRPAIGRLHSLAALSRMVQFRRSYNGDAHWFEQKLKDTAASLPDSVLTPFGGELRAAYVTGAYA